MKHMSWRFELHLRVGVLAESFSSSIMTGRGTMMVQRRLSMREETIDKDERRMLVSTTRTVYPGMMDNGVRE